MTRVPELAPFTGIRYASTFDPAHVTSPPYDVISPAEHQLLLGRHPRNFVRLILPTGGNDRYEHTAQTLEDWKVEGTLVSDGEPCFYLYVMDYVLGKEAGSTAGVIGALSLERFGEGGVFPHEDTMPGPKADRLQLMRTTRANLEPLWFVASEPIPELRSIVDRHIGTTPLSQVTNSSNVVHRIWRVSSASLAELIERVRKVAAIIADGHHRYETAIIYRDERRANDGSGPWDSVLAMVVDPTYFGPTLLPIHRVVRHVETEALVNKLQAAAFNADIRALAEAVSKAGAGTVGIATPRGRWSVRSDASLDTEFLRDLLGGEREVSYENDVEAVADAVEAGATGFVMAPVPLSLVIERALSGERMPPKTTFFWPKPLSGLVFRSLD